MRASQLLFYAILLLFISCQQVSSTTEEESQKEIELKTGTIEHNGASIYYRSIGKGEPILVVHGGPGMDHSYFLPHLDELADSYQLIYFDQRAAGKSSFDLDSSQMSMEIMVEDMEAIRQHFALDKVNILAHSWGGLLAMWYAKSHPEKLKRLMLVNTIAANKAYDAAAAENLQKRRNEEDVAAMQELMQSEAFKNQEEEAFLEVFKLNFAPSFYHKEYLDSLQLAFPDNYRERQGKLMYLMPDLQAYDLYDELAKIKAPTLLVHGEVDATPLAAIEKIAEKIEGSQLDIFSECGHFPFIESKAAFRKSIDKFMHPQ